MAKRRGHMRGTSFSKKKFDKYYGRNYYAKELLENHGKYHTRIVLDNQLGKPVPETKLLKEYYINEED